MSTPNLGLALPANGSTGWDVPLNNNASILDGVVGGGVAGQVLTSQGPGHPGVFANTLTPVKEVPSGTINGTTGSDGNPTFTVSFTPNPVANFVLTKNGVEMYAGTAYTLVGSTITYIAPYIPISGDLHQARYTK